MRGPKHVVRKGKTPVLLPADARLLLDSIEADTLIGLRDRALIGVMVYSFARVSAALCMNVDDYFLQGRRRWCTKRAASTTKFPSITALPSISMFT